MRIPNTLINNVTHVATMLNTRNSGRFVWVNWHQFRQHARTTEYSPEPFAASEKEQYDLDEDNAESITSPAKITGEDNPETYIEEPYSSDRDPYNIREVNPRRM